MYYNLPDSPAAPPFASDLAGDRLIIPPFVVAVKRVMPPLLMEAVLQALLTTDYKGYIVLKDGDWNDLENTWYFRVREWKVTIEMVLAASKYVYV